MNPVLKAALIIIPLWCAISVPAAFGFLWLLRHNDESVDALEHSWQMTE